MTNNENLPRKEKLARYFQENRTQFNHYNAEARDRLKLEMVSAYGGSCVVCGEVNPVKLCLDHIYDDAYAEAEEFGLNARGGHKHYARLKREGWPRDYFQLLCYNCNAEKEYNRRRELMLLRNGPKKIHNPLTWHAKEGPKSNNQSGIKGVYWNTQKARWQSKITKNGQGISLGFFPDNAVGLFNAGMAYAKAAIAQWGAEANVPSEAELMNIAITYYEDPANRAKVMSRTKGSKITLDFEDNFFNEVFKEG